MQKVTYEGQQGWMDETTSKFYPKEVFEQVTYEGKKGLLHTESQQFFPVEAAGKTLEASPDTSFTGSLGQAFRGEAPFWRPGLRAGGAIVGGATSLIGAGVKAIDEVIPTHPMAYFGRSIQQLGEKLGKNEAIGTAVEALSNAYGKASKEHPQKMQDIKDIGSIASIYPGEKIATALLSPVKTGLKAVGRGIEQAEAKSTTSLIAIDKNIDAVIDNGIKQGVKPLTRAAGKRVQGVERFNEAGRTMVKDMVDNKDATTLHNAYGDVVENKLPKNAPQMVESVGQGLSRNAKGYLDAVKRVTGKEVDTPLTLVEKNLSDFTMDEVNQTMSPEAVKYARERLKDFQIIDEATGQVVGTKQFTPSQFERALQAQTSTVKKMVNNPNMDIDKLHVEARIQKALRETQDEVMNKFDGPEYRQFKDNYAAYKQLETDIIQRARVTTRQGPYSLIDFSDIYSLPEMVMGAATGNVPMLAKGALAKGVQKFIKYVNNPDTAINSMFSQVEGLMDKRGRISAYQEATQGMQVPGKAKALPANARTYGNEFTDVGTGQAYNVPRTPSGRLTDVGSVAPPYTGPRMLSPARITEEKFGPLGVSKQSAEAELLRNWMSRRTGKTVEEMPRGVATYMEREGVFAGPPKENLGTPTKIIVKGTKGRR